MIYTPHPYCLGDKIKKNEMGTMYGGEERHIQGFGGKPEGKRQLGRPRHRWDVNSNMDIQKVECGVWTGSSWLRIGTGGGHLRMW